MKDRGSIRNGAMGLPGEFHEPNFHNEATADLPSVKHNVDESRALVHKRWMDGNLHLLIYSWKGGLYKIQAILRHD
jgi:hypothetical protein